MARSKTEIIDEHGNVLPPPEPGSPVANVIYLLEYGRKRGFCVGPTIQVGDTIVQVRDLRQEAQMKKDSSAPELEPGSDMSVLLGGDD